MVSVLNALHLRQYQEYYNAIEKIATGSDSTRSDASSWEELAALNKAAEVKPRILVCAPSNAGIDNVILKVMSDRFVDGNVSVMNWSFSNPFVPMDHRWGTYMRYLTYPTWLLILGCKIFTIDRKSRCWDYKSQN